MKSKLILSTTIAIFALTSWVLAEEVKYPPINPALTYWQSAAVMPDLKGEKSALLNDAIYGKKPIDDVKVKELLSESEQSLTEFARAAASPASCDWGLAFQDGPEMILPHLSKMRELSLLAILKADALFSEGRTKEGIEWLLLTERAARHSGAGDLLISVLVQDSIESTIIYSAGKHCLDWDDVTRKRFVDELKALPPEHNFRDALRHESVFIDWVERQIQSTDPNVRRKLEDMIFRPDLWKDKPEPEREAEAKLIREQLTPGNGRKYVAELRDLNQRTQAAMDKPWKESQLEIEAITKEARQGNALLKIAYPSFESVNIKRLQIATLRTMLDAALQYGPKLDEAAAGSFKDAFDGEPLLLKKADDGGLTLTTAKQYKKGKDIELKLGK